MKADSAPASGPKRGIAGVLAAAGIIILVLLLVGVVPAIYDARIRRTGDDLSGRIFPLHTTNDAIATAMVDQESGQRGYILTGVASFLDPYNAGRARLEDLWQRAEGQAEDVSGRAQELLAAEKEAAQRWQREAGEPEIALARSGQTTSVVASVASGRGKSLFDDYRARSMELTNELDRLESDRIALRTRLSQQLAVIQVGLAVLALGGVATLLYIVRHTQANMLQLVQAEADRRMREEFLSAVSHDLRSPLSTIKGLIQLSGRQAARLGTADGARLAQRMNTADLAVDRMSTMIDQLLDLTRLQQGRALPLDRTEVDLVAIARQAAVEQEQASPRHRIVVEAGTPSLVGFWDKTRLERVLGNLLSNAVKYSPEGGDVNVTVAAEERAGAPWARLSVRDHGLGIPPADLPRVFDRFYRAGNVRGQIRGVGIGLAGSRQIVEQHGGTLTAESELGHGATFTVTLPLQPPFADGDTAENGEGHA